MLGGYLMRKRGLSWEVWEPLVYSVGDPGHHPLSPWLLPQSEQVSPFRPAPNTVARVLPPRSQVS